MPAAKNKSRVPTTSGGANKVPAAGMGVRKEQQKNGTHSPDGAAAPSQAFAFYGQQRQGVFAREDSKKLFLPEEAEMYERELERMMDLDRQVERGP